MSFTNDGKIYYFPQSALEVDPKQRFFQLFQAKKKWSKEELAPFLGDLGTGKGLDTLLVKWARRIKDGNVYYYVAR
jgi:sister chromatid cohesion protein DCC1